MAFTRGGTASHAALADVTATDHHTATVAGDLDLADMNERAHASLTAPGADDHHDEAHTVLSHSDAADSCKIASGVYTGDGAVSQAITGIGFTVLAVWIWLRVEANTTYQDGDFCFSTNLMVDNNAAGMGIRYNDIGNDVRTTTDLILALGTDGFTVDDGGADAAPNTDMAVYEFIAIGIEV